MNAPRRTGLTLALLIFASFHAAAEDAPPPRPFLRSCRLPERQSSAWCGSYEVFEDRESGQGKKIALNIVVVPSLRGEHPPDPVFFFAGGPGQSAASLASVLGEGPLKPLRAERDLVFVDQRGTGESNPLNCDLFEDDTDLRNYFEDMFPVKDVRACRDRLAKTSDLVRYTTDAAVDDLDEVRGALGYTKINLYGGSYGTTVALAYLRKHADHVRSTVLAGVAPTNLELPLPFAKGAQYAIDDLLDDCAKDAACRAAFPKVRAELASVLKRLAKAPASVEVVNPFTEKPQRVSLGKGVFAERLRMMLYDRDPASLVPLLIHRAFQGDLKPFVLATLPQARGIYQSLALGMYFTVTCAEDVPFITDKDLKAETAGTFLGDYRVRVHQRACREWPRAAIPRDFTDPVDSKTPVLLLSGEVDPASPHWIGAEVARHLPNGRQVTVPDGGHSYFSPCIGEMAAKFLSKGSADGLDTTCLTGAKRPPFATTLPEGL
jgi:pimeloyl-ACP methyl ester carboxylesterase